MPNPTKDMEKYIDSLRISAIPNQITVVTERRLTPEELTVIKATGTVNRYVKILNTNFDDENVGYQLLTGTEADITRID